MNGLESVFNSGTHLFIDLSCRRIYLYK